MGRLGCDGNFNMSALFQLNILTMFIGECIFNAEISISLANSVYSNLCLFRLAWPGRDDFVNGARHAGTGLLLGNSSSI